MSDTQNSTQTHASNSLALTARRLSKEKHFWPLDDDGRRRKVLHMVEEFAALDSRSQVFWLATALDSLPPEQFKMADTFFWNRASENRHGQSWLNPLLSGA